MATGLPVAKILIKYNSNNLEENDEEEKEPINIELIEKNWSWNDENAIDFRWSDVKEDKQDIALTNFIENYISKQIRKFIKKSNWMIVV